MKYAGDREHNTQPIEMLIGTNEESFSLGEVLTMSSGKATKGGVDSDGTQMYVCVGAATGDGSTANVPAMRIRRSMKFQATSTATVASSLVGSAVTLHTDAIKCTATGTKGVFVIDETDGATAVVGHFNTGI